MTMNNDPTDTVQAMPAIAKPMRIAELLRTQLDTPKPKDEAWQTEAGRAVSMLAIEFLNEVNDVAALRSVALLGLAQLLGVKEARKRTIKLSRWAEAAPPPLTTLALKDEQQAALTALTKLTTTWSRLYAAQALADLSLPDEFASELLKWVRATYADNLSFAKDFYASQLAAAKSPERTMVLLKDGGKLLKPSKPVAAAKLAECLILLVDTFFQSNQPANIDEKVFGSSVAALANLMQEQAAVVPAMLLQPIFVKAVSRLAVFKSNSAASKQVSTVTDALTLATISLLVADMERYGSQAADHWRAMIPTWRAAYPGWDASIALATVMSPALAVLTVDSKEAVLASSNTYAIEAVFARLLPAWDAFIAELPDANRAASLSAMLQQAAGTVGIAPMGEKGAVVSFDPLSHHMVEGNGESHGQVRIVRPGVLVQRSDGSIRVLVAALVATV